MAQEMAALKRLAALYGVQSAYLDIRGKRVDSPSDAIVAALKVLGASIEGSADAAVALRERSEEMARRICEPIYVVWDKGSLAVDVQVPVAIADGRITAELTLESGERRAITRPGKTLRDTASASIGRERFVQKRLVISGPLPFGYHRIEVRTESARGEAMVIVAPTRSYDALPGGEQRGVGIFLPLYALQSRRSWGAGDLVDLGELAQWAKRQRVGLVGALPMLASFLDRPFDPSPYAPVSRLHWNEFYVNVEALPEYRDCDEAQRLVASRGFREAIAALRKGAHVDYKRVMALKRRVLELLTTRVVRGRGSHGLERFLKSDAGVERYAAFRATVERYGDAWPAWPKNDAASYDIAARDYHCYVQWAAHRQLRQASRKGAGLYLDLPIGVHGGGYDTWAHRDAFALGMSVGAPPDSYIETGQDWGFPPLHPERIREQGYGYPIAYLRKHMQMAKALRVDHVMGFQRLFWVPRGLKPVDGIYVRYHPEEWYAILSLESHRNKCWVIGENLGVVPPEVNASLERHRFGSMYMLQFSIRADPQAALGEVPKGAVAALNNHDMPPFASFWSGDDFKWRRRLGILTRKTELVEKTARGAQVKAIARFLKERGSFDGQATTETILSALHRYLVKSRAKLVVVSLEDLWGETQPQNVPGTGDPQPNWRRRARMSLEEFSRNRAVMQALEEIVLTRSRKRP